VPTSTKVNRRGGRRRLGRAGISLYLATTFGLTVVVLVTVLSVTSMATYSRDRRDATAKLQGSADTEARTLSNSLGQTVSYLQQMVSGPDLSSLDPARCTSVLSGLGGIVTGASIALVRADGSVVCGSNPKLLDPGRFRAYGAFLTQVMQGGQPVIQSPATEVLTGAPALLAGAPVVSPTGQHAVFLATFQFTMLVTGPTSSFPKNAVYTVLSADRATVLMRVPSSAVGTKRVTREATVSPAGWHVLVGMTADAAFAAADRDLRRSVAAGLLTVGLLLALGLLLYRRLARPVRRLRATIEAAGTDNTVRAALEGPAEVAAVAEAFNSTIAERRALEDQLAHQALHDPLTNLPNRALLSDRLTQALARRQRDNGLVAVAFMDLDRFKLINDSHGHPAGDQLLVALGRRLSGAVRPADTVARFGGDEFVVLAEGLDGVEEATAIADRLTTALNAPFDLGGEEIYLSGSVGLAIARGDDDAHELIRNADSAMYRAKDHFRGGFAIYDEHMHEGVVHRLQTERDLHRALDENELVVHYQPKCSLRDGAIDGVEALVRWAHPTRGLVNPIEFIPIAEETGLIQPLGEWVLTEACRQSAAWDARYGFPISVSVNLSARQLARPDLPETVSRVLAETGVNPSSVWLEVTEGSLLGDANAAAASLHAIRDLGVRIAIDDFGTGYSSLAYLRNLPLDEVKIDRSFINDVATDPTAAAIVASIVSLGHALGLVVVAEGVETTAQLDKVRELGCDLAQGFYLSRPKTAADLAGVLGSNHGQAPRLGRESSLA
jgi:diguanylate cyclase (GGDEF)-like protein